jgi:hypothetical protein
VNIDGARAAKELSRLTGVKNWENRKRPIPTVCTECE